MTTWPRYLPLVRHEDDRLTFGGQQIEEFHYLTAGRRVQIPGRLVGKENARPHYQRTRDGHALAFATGEFVRLVLHSVAKAGPFERFEDQDPWGHGNGQPLARNVVTRHPSPALPRVSSWPALTVDGFAPTSSAPAACAARRSILTGGADGHGACYPRLHHRRLRSPEGVA